MLIEGEWYTSSIMSYIVHEAGTSANIVQAIAQQGEQSAMEELGLHRT